LAPVIAQKDFVKLRLVATGGQAPVNNFEIFAGHSLFQHEFFSYLALTSAVLVCLLLILMAASWTSNTLPMRNSWIAASLLAIILMLPITAWLYLHLPGMKYINFPWRYLFVVSLLIALFLAHAASQSKRARWMIAVTALGFAAAWFAMWPPTWLHNPEASWGKYSAARTAELPGVQELMPISARYDEEGRYGPSQLVSVESGACKMLQVQIWQSEHRVVRFDCQPDTTLVIKTFFYPGWKIIANGRPAPVAFNEQGAFLAKVQGAGYLEMTFAYTQDRKLGVDISRATIFIWLAWFAIQRRRLLAT
jgi:hypothetical protein